MKKIVLFSFLTLPLILLKSSLFAQCGSCVPEKTCKPITLSDHTNPSLADPCPLVFCIEQQLSCGGSICQSYQPLCSSIKHIHPPSPPSEICFYQFPQFSESCFGCEIVTTSIKIYRQYPGGTVYTTISLSSSEINTLMSILSGNGGSFQTTGVLNDCEGNNTQVTIQVGTHPSGGLYSIVN